MVYLFVFLIAGVLTMIAHKEGDSPWANEDEQFAFALGVTTTIVSLAGFFIKLVIWMIADIGVPSLLVFPIGVIIYCIYKIYKDIKNK